MTNSTILKVVTEKTYILDTQLQVIEEVLIYCEGHTSDDMDSETYERAINDCAKIK